MLLAFPGSIKSSAKLFVNVRSVLLRSRGLEESG